MVRPLWVGAALDCKTHTKKGNLWVATISSSVRFMAMKCPINFQKEKIGACMAVARAAGRRWIKCKGFICLATLDAGGKWLCFVSGQELKNVVEVHCD
jgi:hypothetical protein